MFRLHLKGASLVIGLPFSIGAAVLYGVMQMNARVVANEAKVAEADGRIQALPGV